jgi:hypothetical protein
MYVGNYLSWYTYSGRIKYERTTIFVIKNINEDSIWYRFMIIATYARKEIYWQKLQIFIELYRLWMNLSK